MKKLILLSLIFFNFSYASEIDQFQFMSEEFPPYNYTSNKIATGSSVETFQLFLKELKSTKSIENISFWPWARSYGTLLNSPNNLLFVVTRTPARENLFKWVGPISTSRNVIFGKKKFKFIQDSNKTIDKYKYCIVREDAAGQILREKFKIDPENIFEAAEPFTCIQLIKNDRADLFAYDLNVAKWIITKNNDKFDDFEDKLTLSESEHYIAFSKQTSDETINKFQNALNKVKASKEFKQIREKYFKK